MTQTKTTQFEYLQKGIERMERLYQEKSLRYEELMRAELDYKIYRARVVLSTPEFCIEIEEGNKIENHLLGQKVDKATECEFNKVKIAKFKYESAVKLIKENDKLVKTVIEGMKTMRLVEKEKEALISSLQPTSNGNFE